MRLSQASCVCSSPARPPGLSAISPMPGEQKAVSKWPGHECRVARSSVSWLWAAEAPATFILVKGVGGSPWGGGCSGAGRAAPEATTAPLSCAGTGQIWARGHGQERTVCTLRQRDPGCASVVAVITCLCEQKATGVATFQLHTNAPRTWEVKSTGPQPNRGVTSNTSAVEGQRLACGSVRAVSHASCPCVSLRSLRKKVLGQGRC